MRSPQRRRGVSGSRMAASVGGGRPSLGTRSVLHPRPHAAGRSMPCTGRLEIHLDPPTKRIDLQHFAHPKPRVSAQKQCPVLLPNLRLPWLVHTTNEQQLNRLPVRPLPATFRRPSDTSNSTSTATALQGIPRTFLHRLLTACIYLLRIQKLFLSTRRPHPILHRPLLHPQHRTYTQLIRRPNHRLRKSDPWATGIGAP